MASDKKRIHELEASLVGLELQNKELRQALAEVRTALHNKEQQFCSYFELPFTGRAITSPGKGWIDVNQALCDMLGYTKSELLKTTWTELTHPDDLGSDIEQFNRVLSNQSDGYTIYKRFIHKEGQIVYAHLAVQCVRHPDAQADYFVAIIMDLSDLKKVEEDLQKKIHELRRFNQPAVDREMKYPAAIPYRILVEEMNEGAVSLTRDGTILYYNRRCAELLFLPSEHLVGSNFSQFIEKSDIKNFRKLLNTGAKVKCSGVVTCRARDGNSMHLLYSLCPMPAGSSGDVFMVITDISELKQMENALRQSRDDFERRVDERTAELRRMNGELVASRLAILNMMTDAVESKKSLENVNSILTSEITERKLAELSLKKSREQYRNLFENSLLSTMVIDREGIFQMVNQTAANKFGLPRDEIIGKSIFDLLPHETAQKYFEYNRSLIDSRGQLEYEDSFLLKGEQKTFFILDKAIGDDNGVCDTLLSTSIDITERTQLENVRDFLITCGYPGSRETFFESLAKYLSKLLGAEYICIDKLEGDGLTAQTIAVYNEGQFEPNVSYTLKQTPCGEVVGKTICCFPEKVCQLFPYDDALQELKAESYIGTTLWSFDGRPIGLIAVIGQKPMKNTAFAEEVLKLVSIRAAGEIERKQVEEELRMAKENAEGNAARLKMAAEVSNSGSYEWDISKGIFYWSDEFLKLFGLPKNTVAGFDVWIKALHPDDVEPASRKIQEAIENRSNLLNEYRIILPGNEVRWIRSTGHVTYDNDTPVRMLGMCMDISKQKQGETEIQAINESLETRIAERTRQLEIINNQLAFRLHELEQFSYISNHDLKEPLRTLMQYTGFIKEDYAGKLDEDGNKYVEFVSMAAVRMDALIRDLFEYSLLGKERVRSVVACKKIVEDVLSDMNDTVQKSNARITVRELPVLNGCETELRLLFQNLISNAIKYQGNGNVPEIGISAEDRENEWFFSIKDNGIGIDKKYHEKIFIIFQRLHNRNEFEGTGIGLAHCKKIVELHGGKIWFESTPGTGSVFMFTIPK